VQKGETIVHHLDGDRAVFFLTRGAVRVITHAASGRQVSFRDIDAGEIFGEFAAIDGRPRSATVVALADCTVAMLSAELFWSLVREHPDFAEVLLKHLTALVRLYSERVREFATLPVPVRLRLELLRLARGAHADGDHGVMLPAFTHSEMADRIGTHREAVTRELSRLRRTNVLRSRGRRLEVPDLGRLEAIVETELGELADP
jgi:CRP/FNR family transcriptional regulator, cyclic AMP receptor protein